MSLRRGLYLLIPLIAGAVGACRSESASRPAAKGQDDRLLVYASIPPQKYIVERVGGQHVRVGVLLKPGQSMHTYEPTPRQMVELSAAKAYFRIGAPFETQVAEKIGRAVRTLEMVDVNADIPLRRQTEPCEHEGHEGHEHEGDHDDREGEPGHGHTELDMHTWMSPRLVKNHARNVRKALEKLDPAHRSDYEANLAALEADLDQLDAEIAASLEPLKGRSFLVYHPAFGYFADAYGLRQIAVETGGKQPSPKQLSAMIERAKTAGVKLIFVQPQFSRKGAEIVANAIGGAVLPLDPMEEDYIANLRHVAGEIKRALTSATSAPADRSP